MKRIGITVIAVLFLTSIALRAQEEQPPPGPPPGGPGQPQHGPGQPGQPRGQMGPPQGQPPQADPLADNFFPPELLIQNQKKIGLTEEQSKYIREEIGKTQAKFTDVQWQLQGEQETLTSLVKQERPDEKQVLAALDKLLNLENEIKRTHLTLALRIKNKLTPEQQAQLRELRQRPRGPMPGGPGGQGGPGGAGGPGGPAAPGR